MSSSEDTLRYVRDLMAKNYEAVGFLPEPRVRQYAERGQLWLQTENDDPCGYLIVGNGWPIRRIYQACIQYDARRQHHAEEMVRRAIREAEQSACAALSLWCADDLDANLFWQACGFQLVGTREGGVRRGRVHNAWMLWLASSRQLSLFGTDDTLGGGDGKV